MTEKGNLKQLELRYQELKSKREAIEYNKNLKRKIREEERLIREGEKTNLKPIWRTFSVIGNIMWIILKTFANFGNSMIKDYERKERKKKRR